MYRVKFSNSFEKSMKKLKKKNRPLFNSIIKKVEEIIKFPEHFKPLRNVLKGIRRIRISSFVLKYKIDYENKIIKIISLEHHDKAYK